MDYYQEGVLHMKQAMKWGSVLILILFTLLMTFQYCAIPEVPDVTPPIVTIVFPAAGAVVNGQVQVVAIATDESKVETTTLYIDGIKAATADDNKITFVWNTIPIADNRDHYLMAVAEDENQNIGTSLMTDVRVVPGVTPDTLAPIVTILNPVSGQVVSGTVAVATQVDDDSPIDRVEFYVDGTLAETDSDEPFGFLWNVSSLINGTVHTLFAKAFDVNGSSSASNVVTVTISSSNIQDITPPSVAILYPPNGAVFTAVDSITASADVTDNESVQRVDFFVDGIFKTSITSPPYLYKWPLTDYADGFLHTLYVKGLDDAGNTGAAMVVITVNP